MAEKRIISVELMKIMALFESVTHVSLKDCFIDESNKMLTFIVPEGQIGKAVGKGASNVKKLELKLKRKVKIAEFSKDISKFIKGLLFPLKVVDVVEIDEGVYQVEPADIKTRGMIIGRSAANLRNLEKIVSRFYEIKEIKVAG